MSSKIGEISARPSRAFGNVKSMELTVHIPDDSENLSRRALGALLAEEYRLGHLHKPDLDACLALKPATRLTGS